MSRLLVILVLVGLLAGGPGWADKKKPHHTSLAGLIYTTATSNHPTSTGYDAVEGADIVLDGTEYKTTTDKKGSWEFEDLPDGTYHIIASKTGFETVQKSIAVVNGNFPDTTQLVMNPTGSQMVGDTPTGRGTVYVAFAARQSSLVRNDGQTGIPLVTQQLVRGAIVNGVDPFSMSSNLPDPKKTPGNDWNPTTSDPNTIMMYPPASPTRTGFQSVGSVTPYWLCFDKTGSVLYVSNSAQQIMVMDAIHNNSLMANLPAQGFVTDLERSPDGRYILAGVMSANSFVMLIDTKTRYPLAPLPLPLMQTHESGTPRAVLMTPDGRVLVLMGTSVSGEVVALDPTSGKPVGSSVPVGSNPTGMALSPDGKVLFVANSGSGNLSVVDAVTMLEVTRITVGVGPQKVAVAPDGTRVFVTNKQSNSVSVVDAKSLGVLVTTPVGQGPVGVVCSGAPGQEARVFVSCKDAGTVCMLDGKTGAVLHTTVPMPQSSPFGLAVKP